MRIHSVSLGLSAILGLLLAAPPLAHGAQQFPKDPLKNLSSGKRVVGEFMELRPGGYGLHNLHTGIDISCPPGTEVYPPVAPGVQVWLAGGEPGGDQVLLEADGKQDAQYTFCLFGHISPRVHTGTSGHYVTADTLLGWVASNSTHLHAEIWLDTVEPSELYPQIWSVNPRGNGFKDVTDWTTDTTNPIIEGTPVVHVVNGTLVFEVHAYDRVDADANWRNGIKGLEVCINNWPTASFEFTAKGSHSAWDYYYCTTCYPDGSNALQYKLTCSQPSSDYEWYVSAWDGEGNPVQTDPVHSTVTEAADLDTRVKDGQVRLHWVMHSLTDVANFDVLERCGRSGPFAKVNDTPIPAMADQSEYDFIKPLPEIGDTLWYRVIGFSSRGSGFLVTEQHVPNHLPVANSLLVSPNPSSGTFRIHLQLRRNEKIRAAIFETTGRLVRTLYDGQLLAGRTTLDWDGRDDQGRSVAAGVHYARVELESSGDLLIDKLIVLR